MVVCSFFLNAPFPPVDVIVPGLLLGTVMAAGGRGAVAVIAHMMSRDDYLG